MAKGVEHTANVDFVIENGSAELKHRLWKELKELQVGKNMEPCADRWMDRQIDRQTIDTVNRHN